MSSDPPVETPFPALVSTAWLAEKLADPECKLVVLEVTMVVKEGQAQYISKHIPGARFLDLNRYLRPTPLIPRTPPSAADFQDCVRAMGVSKDTNVVLYDRGASPILASTRAWWTFRLYGHNTVSVLDGGLKKWEYESRVVNSGEETAWQNGDFVSHSAAELMVSFEDMEDLYCDPSSQILDVRQSLHFDGKDDEPTQYTRNACLTTEQPLPTNMRKGHIPGSVNIPFDTIFNPEVICDYLELKKLPDVQKALEEVDIDLRRPLTIMCYAGNTACTWALATHMLGNKDTTMYCGSWTEWAQRCNPNGATMESQSDNK